MSEERIARLGISIESSSATKARAELRGLAGQARQTETATGRLERQTRTYGAAQERTNTALRTASGFIRQLQFAASSLIAALGVRQVISYADAWQAAINRLRIVISSTQELTTAQDRLFEISQKTFQSFSGSADLFSRMALATRDFGKSQEELLRISELTGKAVALSGANAQSAQNALIQFGQAIAADFSTGVSQEFNSIIEQVPALAQAIADGLGVGVRELKKLVEQGELSTEKVFAALLKSADDLEERFGRIDPTFGQLFQRLDNEITRFFGRQGALFAPFKDAIRGLTDNFADVANAVKAAGAALIAFIAIQLPSFAASAASSLAVWFTRTTAVAKATVELNTAVASGNAILLGSAAAQKARTAFLAEEAVRGVAFSKTQVQIAEARLADATATTAQLRASLPLIEAQRAEAVSQLELARGIRAATGLRQAQIVAEANLARTMAAGLATRKALAAAEIEIAAAQGLVASTGVGLIAAQTAQTAAMTAAAARAGIFARALTGLRGVFAGLWAIIAANPITATALAVAGLVFGLVSLKNALDKRKIEEFDAALRKAFAAAGQELPERLKEGLDKSTEDLEQFKDDYLRILAELTKGQREELAKLAQESLTFPTPGGPAGLGASFRQPRFGDRRATEQEARRQAGELAAARERAEEKFFEQFPGFALLAAGAGPKRAPAAERAQFQDAAAQKQTLELLIEGFQKGDRAARVYAVALELAGGKAKLVGENTKFLADQIVALQDRLDAAKISRGIEQQVRQFQALAAAFSESAEQGRLMEEALKLFGATALENPEKALKATREFLDAQSEAQTAQLTAGLEEQREQLSGLAGEYQKGERAARVFSKTLEIQAQNFGLSTAEAKGLADQLIAIEDAQSTLKIFADIERQAESIGRLQSALSGGFRGFEIAAKQAALIEQGFRGTEAELLAAARAAVELDRALERINRQAQRLQATDIDPLESFNDNFADAVVDFWENFRAEGFDSFRDLGQAFKDVFRRLAFDLFATAFIKPLVDAVTLAFSNVNTDRRDPNAPKNLITGEGFDTRSGLQRAFDGLEKNFTKLFEDLGDLLGKISKDLGKAFKGIAGTLGKLAAAAGAGFAGFQLGSQISDLLGIEGNKKSQQAGGAIGGGIGFLSGAGLGPLGAALGPFGAIAGTIVGAAIGALIGGAVSKPSANAAGANVGLATLTVGESFAKNNSSENISLRDQIVEVAITAVRQVQELAGATFSELAQLVVNVNDRQGIRIQTALGTKQFDKEDAKKAIEAAIKESLKLLQGGEPQITLLARRLADTDASVETIVGALGALKTAFDLVAEPVSEFRKSLEDFGKAFDKALAETKDFEKAQAQLLEGRVVGLRRFARSFDDDIRRQATALSAPAAGQVSDLLDQQKQRVEDALAINKDLLDALRAQGAAPASIASAEKGAANRLKQVSDLGALEFKALIEQIASTPGAIAEAIKGFRDFREELAKVSPEAVKDIAKGIFAGLKAAAEGFDESVSGQIRAIESPTAQRIFDLLEAQTKRFEDALALNAGLLETAKDAGVSNAKRRDIKDQNAERLASVSELATLEFKQLLEQIASTPGALGEAAKAFEDFRAQLVASGTDPARIDQALGGARAAAASAINETVQKDILRFRSPSFAAFKDLLEQQKQLEDFAKEVGANLFAVQARNAAERQKFFESLSEEQKAELGDFLGLIEDVSGRLAVVLTQLEDHIERYVDSAEEQAKATREAAEAFEGFARSIGDSLFNINAQFGAGNPEERLATQQEEFFRLAAAAKGGDQTAFDKLGPLGEQIVGQARDLFAGTAQFATIRDTITGVLTTIQTLASDQASALFAEADRADTELEALKDIRNLLGDPESNDILRDILDSGRLQNDLSRALVTELIMLRDAQAQNDQVTLQQLQAATFAESSGGGSNLDASASNDNSQTFANLQNQLAKSNSDLGRKIDATNTLLADQTQEIKRLGTELERDRAQRALG